MTARSEQRQRTVLVALRLLPAEHAEITAAAQSRGVSLSALLRDTTLTAIRATRAGGSS